jgi:hypothetical protein
MQSNSLENVKNPLDKVNDTIDEIIQSVLIEIQKNNVNTSSFYIFMINIVTKSMNVVEELGKDKEGHVKKYIVVSVGRVIVEQYYPEHLNFYNEQIDNIIELLIDSYYMLQSSKGKRTLKTCLPCLF